MENKKSVDLVTSLGIKALTLFATVKDMFYLLMQILHWLFIGPFKGKAAKRDSIFDQMVFVGVKSIVIVFLLLSLPVLYLLCRVLISCSS